MLGAVKEALTKLNGTQRRGYSLRTGELQSSNGCRDQQDDNAKRDGDLDHCQNLRPAREQRRVGRTECRALCERDEQIIDKARVPARTRKFGSLVVRDLHLWEKETFAAEPALLLSQSWPAAVQAPVPQSKHDHVRQPKQAAGTEQLQ